MSQLLAAVMLFVIFNAVGLALARSWLRFAVFYVAAVAIWAVVAAVTILTAEPGIPDSWPGHTDAFGHEITDGQALAVFLPAYWLVLLAIGAIAIRLSRTSRARRLSSRLDELVAAEPPDAPEDESREAARPPLVLSGALLALGGWFLSRGEWLFAAAFLLVVGLWLARAVRLGASAGSAGGR